MVARRNVVFSSFSLQNNRRRVVFISCCIQNHKGKNIYIFNAMCEYHQKLVKLVTKC